MSTPQELNNECSNHYYNYFKRKESEVIRVNYKPNVMCKRFVDVDKLRELEGQTFKSFRTLVRTLGWSNYSGGDMKRCDIQRLSYYCELKFEENSQRVTVVRVY